ncbi:MAG TPA: polyprenyl synthetase family protein [Chitinophagales bacterium]|jgi:octaprenyl-diphosphate synthase|nr:polyprenyl synthetase family protein [Chitinophagales bacterium]HPA37063.1 polyprenyl synthetase family protein [Chitinophagales bacterium]HQD12219.1 polyprenyl synthetase family protein [Chitinophagales bacterium]HQO30847.1 polyprenyl synthetase family protein [Chitinophagales bacterium]HQO89870.1 polyprenyl synthetase family protein [Chitinophagales bacterium]
MSNKVDDLKAPIEKELELFEQKFRDVMRSHVALLDKVNYYIYQRKGKQVRPMFIFLAAKMCGEVTEATYTGASLVELLHTATLVHDDVVDDSYERRGFFSINALWKNKIAVLVGDYFLSKGLLLALEAHQYQLLHIVSAAVKRMSEGELLQMEKARRLDIDEAVYFEIIRNKTASLIAAACEVGAASTTTDTDLIEKMRQVGEYIGIAFQIKDDLFDYGEADVGKPRGIDIKERKMTLPLIYTLNNCSSSEKKWIINTVKNHNEDKERVDELIRFIHQKGGIEYTRQQMYVYKQKAFDIIDTIPDSAAKAGMVELVDYITERNY